MDHATVPQSAQIRVFAKVTLGAMLIGIDARHVVSAQPRPTALTRLPRYDSVLDGVFSMGGQLVPLVDLRRWIEDIGESDQRSKPAQVIVLQSDSATLGLAVDAVNGLVRLPDSSIRQVHHDEAEDGFFHSVGVLADGGLISLLDPARLMRQTRLWAENAGVKAGGGDSGGAIGEFSRGQTCAALTPAQVLVRIGETTLGVDAALVAEVCNMPRLQHLAFGASVVSGMMNWHGHHVPVLDADRAIDIGRPDVPAASLAMVLSYDEHYAALPIDRVHSVRQFNYAGVQRPDEAGLGDSDNVAGVARLEDGTPVLLIDGSALLKRYAVHSLSDLSARSASTTALRSKFDPQAYVVFYTGVQWALPMRCFEEISAFPIDFRRVAAADPTVAGSCTWRGRMLPVVDLRENSTGDLPQESQRLMVVRHRERVVGLWVDDLISLLPSNSVEQSRFSLPGLGPVWMLTASEAQKHQSYRLLDLDLLPFFANAAG